MSNELFIDSIQFSMYEHNENKLYIFLLSRNILITVGRTFSLKVKLAYAKLLLLQHGASNKEKNYLDNMVFTSIAVRNENYIIR